MTIGEAIRTVRHRKGWTQAKLSGLSGVSVAAIRLIESGTRNPRWVTVLKIADAVKTTPQELAALCDGTEIGEQYRGRRTRPTAAGSIHTGRLVHAAVLR